MLGADRHNTAEFMIHVLKGFVNVTSAWKGKEKKRKREMFLAKDHHRKRTGHVFEAKKDSIVTERVVKVILDLLAQDFCL